MKIKITNLLGLCLCILLTSCASLTGFEEGRTLGEGNNEFGVSLNYVNTPDIFSDDEEITGDIGFPNLEFNYKRGITEKLDVGGRVSTNLNASTYAKYQLVGDRNSSFALSPGLELGTVFGIAYTVAVPVYASIYPTESITINVNPRFVFQTIPGEDSFNYLGGNVGLLFGKKNKFGFDFGYYAVGGEGLGTSTNLLTFGVGGRFRFGENIDSASSSSRRGARPESSSTRQRRRR